MGCCSLKEVSPGLRALLRSHWCVSTGGVGCCPCCQHTHMCTVLTCSLSSAAGPYNLLVCVRR